MFSKSGKCFINFFLIHIVKQPLRLGLCQWNISDTWICKMFQQPVEVYQQNNMLLPIHRIYSWVHHCMWKGGSPLSLHKLPFFFPPPVWAFVCLLWAKKTVQDVFPWQPSSSTRNMECQGKSACPGWGEQQTLNVSLATSQAAGRNFDMNAKFVCLEMCVYVCVSMHWHRHIHFNAFMCVCLMRTSCSQNLHHFPPPNLS